jgi:transcriptional regulator with XRE-family HTH domain
MKVERKSSISPIVLIVGRNIKNIIFEKKLRQRDVAHDAGLDVENLRKYIKGTQEMKISKLLKIAQALNIEPSELLKDLKIE